MINRIMPGMPIGSYKTYALRAPIQTHYRRASCAEVDCSAHQNGWVTKIDETTSLGQQQAYYIRNQSGRAFKEERDGAITKFTFFQGQQCFKYHVVQLDRDPILIVRDGDWRGNPTGNVRRHVSTVDWVDDFANHQQQLADRLERG
jgi:hypothetical protein